MMAEKWNEIYTKQDIARIQSIELSSLVVFLKLCNQLGIECFLYGGSLLGAVKYGGFVPWDDDLDLALLRKDYNKLIDEGPALLSNEYEIQHPRITKHTVYPYIKFRKKNTRMVEYWNRKLKINHGIYFDIYPLDNIPDDDKLYLQQKQDYDYAVHQFQLRENWRLDHPIRSIRDFLVYWYRYGMHLMLKVRRQQFYVERIEKISTRYNHVETKRQGNLSFPKLGNFFNGVFPAPEIKFETFQMKIPKGYEVNLKNRYGNIKELPPENERIGHKPYELDFGDEK